MCYGTSDCTPDAALLQEKHAALSLDSTSLGVVGNLHNSSELKSVSF